MPIWVRALILGLSLIGYIIVCIYTVKKHYKKCQSSGILEEELKEIKKYDIVFIIMLSVIILVVLVFVCPTYIFLSYYKMLIVTILLFVFSVSLLIANTSKLYKVWISVFVIIIIATIIMVFFTIKLNNTIVYTETDTVVETITPSMFSEKKIAYTCDNEGNIDKYFYYYQDNGKWKYQEFDGSETEVVDIKNEDTYIKKTTTTIECVNTEKKPSAKDYTFEETKVKYNLFINYEQTVEITN